MDISGKNVKVWRKDYEGRNGTYYRYTVNVASKREDGTYASVYLPIKFAKKTGAPERISNGTPCDFSGFLSVDSYKDREGNEVKNLTIIAMSAKFYEEKTAVPKEDMTDSFEQLDEEIPFN